MNTRIKTVRKNFGLTMEKFGERLGVTKAAISKLEKGERNLTEQMAKAICREFNVNYMWLMDGVGDMQADIDSSAMARIDALMTGENEFAKTLFKEFAKLDSEEWKVLEKVIRNISKNI